MLWSPFCPSFFLLLLSCEFCLRTQRSLRPTASDGAVARCGGLPLPADGKTRTVSAHSSVHDVQTPESMVLGMRLTPVPVLFRRQATHTMADKVGHRPELFYRGGICTGITKEDWVSQHRVSRQRLRLSGVSTGQTHLFRSLTP